MGFLKNKKPNIKKTYNLEKALKLVRQNQEYIVEQVEEGKYQLIHKNEDRKHIEDYKKRKKELILNVKNEVSIL